MGTMGFCFLASSQWAQYWPAAHWELGRASGGQTHKASFAHMRELGCTCKTIHTHPTATIAAATAGSCSKKGWGLLIWNILGKDEDHLMDCCEEFSKHMEDKIAQIPLEVTETMSCQG